MENADKNVIFAQRLNIELDKLKITQGEFCKKVDISTGALFNYKTGKRLPDIDNLIKLAEEFNCSTDYLLGLIDIKSTNDDYQFIHKLTGLSDKAIEYLNNCYNETTNQEATSTSIKTINYLIENEDKYHLIKNLNDFIWLGNSKYNQQVDIEQAVAKVKIDKALFNMDNDIRTFNLLEETQKEKNNEQN